MLKLTVFILLGLISTIAPSQQHLAKNSTIEITPKQIKQVWQGSYPDTEQAFIIAHNKQQWEQLWHLISKQRKTPKYSGGVGVYIFIGQQLPSNIEVKLLKLKHRNQETNLYWKKAENLNQLGVTAFLDSWVVFLLEETTPHIDRLNRITEEQH